MGVHIDQPGHDQPVFSVHGLKSLFFGEWNKGDLPVADIKISGADGYFFTVVNEESAIVDFIIQ